MSLRIDEMVEAVEAFMEWRENSEPLTAIDSTLVERWRSALEQSELYETLNRIKDRAEWAKDPHEFENLVMDIRSGNV